MERSHACAVQSIDNKQRKAALPYYYNIYYSRNLPSVIPRTVLTPALAGLLTSSHRLHVFPDNKVGIFQ